MSGAFPFCAGDINGSNSDAILEKQKNSFFLNLGIAKWKYFVYNSSSSAK